jgi:protein-disulfide isomerase
MSVTLAMPVTPRDHVAGSADAPITIVEYGDYECPFCGRAFYVVQTLQEMLGDRLRFVYRHFPLVTLHPQALAAAETAECADAQDQFWAMHDRLFEHQDALGVRELVAQAADLGLDVRRFERDLLGHRGLPHVRADLQSGAASGVQGTPTFFVNGRLHEGSWNFDSLWSAIVGEAGAERGGPI